MDVMNKTLEKLTGGLTAEQRALLFQKLTQKKNGTSARSPIPRATQKTAVPLSYSQQRMWFLEQMEPEKAWYNICRILWLDGELNQAALQNSLAGLVQRHEALRTTFHWTNDQPTQSVAAALELPWELVDLRELAPDAAAALVRQWATAEATRPFNLEQGPLLRPQLLSLPHNRHALILTFHHLITDGWSLDIFLRELDTLYQAEITNQPARLPDLPVQYTDYALWQRQHDPATLYEKQLAYWQNQLRGELPILQLPTDQPRPQVQSFRGAIQLATLPPSLAQQLQTFSQKEGVTLYMTLLTAFYILLHRYTQQEDILVGTPIANRTRPETEGLLGLFINTLVLRANLAGAPSFRALLQQVRQITLDAYSHQELPFEQLVETLAPDRAMSHNPVFQTFFALQNARQTTGQPTALPLTQVEVVDKGVANFDLLFSIDTPEADGQGLTILAQYSTDLFTAATITRLLGHFQHILQSLITYPDQPIGQLPMLSPAERQQLLQEWPRTQTPYPQACIHQLFEAQVEAAPTTAAIIFGQTQLTYAQLDKRANQLAWRLRRLGVGPDVLVGLFMERSLEMVVAILAILKAGGAYLPLDTAYPPDRLRFMLADSATPVLLTQPHLQERLPQTSAHIICLDEHSALSTQHSALLSSEARLNTSVTPDNLAYVMYTSGSTGQPKGVSVIHRNVVRLVKSNPYTRFASDEVFLQVAPISFDAATLEIWGSLLHGASLVIFPPYTPSLAELGAVLRRYHVTTLWLTAGLFHLMVEEQLDDLKGVRHLLAGGDVLSIPHVRKVLQHLPECQLINGYGPTESTTFTTCFPIQADSIIEPSVPIGWPIANTQTYILDSALQPVPIGVPGELYIGGDGLARNYHNRPGLTAERFIPHPFSQTPGARLYKTGDLVRFKADGSIQFLGRRDHQVKVRGFRIELGEIEMALNQHPAVQDAVVMVRQDIPQDKRIVAYVVPHTSDHGLAGELRHTLSQQLPAYMVPDHFVLLDTLPLNPNGKVDRHRLPAPEPDDAAADVTWAAPRTITEQQIAAIWADLLGRETIGIHHNFFDMGGHSLLVIKAIARIHEQLLVNVPMRTLFEYPTVATFSRLVETLEQTSPAAASPLISHTEIEEGSL
jgi:aspartate racemase